MGTIERYETELIDKLYLELAQFTQAKTEKDRQWEALIFAVQNKIPGETRFETALRIINEHENRSNGPDAGQSEKEGV